MIPHADPDPFRFPLEIGGLRSRHGVGEALVRALHPFGLTTFALGACPHPGDHAPSPFFVTNWPADWTEVYLADGMADHDPVLRAVQHTSDPVSLREIRNGRAGFTLTAEEERVLDLGARFGRSEGLVVPIHGAQGYLGFGSVCGPGPDPDARARIVLQFLLGHAHDRMRALHAAEQEALTVPLSLREREILVAARRGLSDHEIARRIGIAVRTVRFHFENARSKLAARNRTEAIAKAVQAQLLGE